MRGRRGEGEIGRTDMSAIEKNADNRRITNHFPQIKLIDAD
jgi:hypothetical protein